MGANSGAVTDLVQPLEQKKATRLGDGPPKVANSRQQAATELILEVELQRQLDDSRGHPCGPNLPEKGTRADVVGASAIRARIVELGVVEEVVKLTAELEELRLGDMDVFQHSEVEIKQPWPM